MNKETSYIEIYQAIENHASRINELFQELERLFTQDEQEQLHVLFESRNINEEIH